MSKKSQREAREKREQENAERERKFSLTLAEWIQTFVEYYKENPPTDAAMLAYKVALDNLTPDDLSAGCKQALSVCDHIPRAKDILEALAFIRKREAERAQSYGHSPMQQAPESTGELICPSHWPAKDREAAQKIYADGKNMSGAAWKTYVREPGED